MRQRTLPGTDLKVSEVCLGTMTWGEQNSEAEAHAQLDYAFAQGVNFIDTAEMYPVPPNATTQGRTESLPRQLARAPQAARHRRRDQGGGSRPARLDSRRAHRPHARGHRRGGRHEPRAAQDRLHRSLPDPLAAAERADVRRDRVRPAKERSGPSIDEQVEGTGRDDQGGQDPPLRVVERDGVGRLRVPPRREGAPACRARSRSRTATACVSRGVDNDLAETLFREKMSLLAYSPLGGGMLSGKYLRRSAARRIRATRCSTTLGLRFRKPIVHEAVAAYAELAERHGVYARRSSRWAT